MSEPTTLQEAAKGFEGLLAAEAGDTQPPEEQQPSGEAPPQGEAEGEPAEAAETATEGQPEEAAAEEGTDADEGATQTVAPDDLLYTVKLDGTEKQLPVKELARGYLAQADYTRKTQELAEQRKSVEGELQSAKQDRQQYAQLVPLLKQQLMQSLPQEPDRALLEADPIEYLKRKTEYDHHLQRINGAQQEMGRIGQLQAEEQARHLRKIVEEGQTKLRDAIPEWKDDKRWNDDRKAIAQYAINDVGYTPEEVGQAVDHRAILVMRKAMLYDKLMANKPKPVAPKSPAPIRAGSPNSNTPQTRARRASSRLAQTGKVEDAARAFLEDNIV